MRKRGSLLLSLFTAVAALASSAARADTLVLQDGRQVHGRLLSVSRGWVEFQPVEDEASDPLRLAKAEVRAIRFGDDDQASDFALRETGGGGDRIEAQEPPLAPRVEPQEPPLAPRDASRRGRMITVPATERWTDSGIDVIAGDVISFSIAGTVRLGDDKPLGAAGDPDGAAVAPRRPLPDRPAGALLGRIGMSPEDTFFIGAERLPFRVRTSGRLYLGVNDDTPDDDGGAFQVAVTR